MKTMN